MAAKTVHVYPSDGAWAVKEDGQKAETLVTKREAVDVAVRHTKKGRSGQLVIHAKDGRILDHRTYGTEGSESAKAWFARLKKNSERGR